MVKNKAAINMYINVFFKLKDRIIHTDSIYTQSLKTVEFVEQTSVIFRQGLIFTLRENKEGTSVQVKLKKLLCDDENCIMELIGVMFTYKIKGYGLLNLKYCTKAYFLLCILVAKRDVNFVGLLPSECISCKCKITGKIKLLW
jgi:hypothetical protein